MIEIINQEHVIEFYGVEAQARQAMEECAELIQAINKMLRKKENAKKHLAEEIGDVLICIEQLKRMFDISEDEIQQWIDFKEARECVRMNQKENG